MNAIKEKILILVKTYPTFSKKYFELVCTAGINEKGAWRRIYPIPFRDLSELEQYKKYQWIDVEIQRNSPDPRPESFKLSKQHIKILGEPIDTKNNWQERKNILFKNTKVFNNLNKIIEEAHNNKMSLCIFKPKEMIDFTVENTDREWRREILQQIERENNQPSLFPELQKEINLVKKLPFKFSYKFKDIKGKESKLMIEDWEIGQLYWNCLKRKNNEQDAIKDVSKKYKNEFLNKKDIYLFLGTTKEFHIRKAKNPYVIIGVFYPPKTYQNTLF